MADGLVVFCDLDLADDFEVFDDGLALVEDLTPADDCFLSLIHISERAGKADR